MADPRLSAFDQEMSKIIEFLHGEYGKLQTGRASASLVEHVEVEAYGQKQPLKTIAGITIDGARSIVVQPWDRSVLQNVEKALQSANLGVNPVNDGQVLRINLPPMTEERRTQMVKTVGQLAEEARISVRQQRQKIHDLIKEGESDEDARYTGLDQLEKAVKAANEKIEEIKEKKEKEVMTV
ncbi:ribosome recycling factor [Candidatus Peregrinibacteria bacterium CG10_big_fil_rev_8_21_14_0_10_55_24]|nr:MAG: ribosome recycling factor [Candidatus Peregrinibacteria bacterium CG10_big_fil_rev_8_21_14_0_10_55_24]